MRLLQAMAKRPEAAGKLHQFVESEDDILVLAATTAAVNSVGKRCARAKVHAGAGWAGSEIILGVGYTQK